MKVAIITGGSRGLGLALVETYCENGFKVVSISRGKSQFEHPNLVRQIKFDLANIEKFDELENEIFSLFNQDQVSSIVLINNAAITGDVKKIGNGSGRSINQTIQINLTAPLILSSVFIRHFKEKAIPFKILNISSGAAVRPIFGLTNYCTSKAGMEMMTKTIAVEQEENKNFCILSISPGIVDTDMQNEIRKSSKEDFKDLETFKAFKENNQLVSAKEVANKIYFACESENHCSGETLNLREMST